MNVRSARLEDSASPWMVAVSGCVHGFILLGILAASAWFPAPPRVEEPPVMRLKLVDEEPSPPVLETASLPHQDSAPVPEIEDTQPDLIPEIPAQAASPIVEAKAVEAPPKPMIPLKKPKRTAKRIEPRPKPEPQKKPDKPKTEQAEKPRSPDSILEDRLAAIRKEVEEKRAAAAARGASETGTGRDDGEFRQWIRSFRRQVNAHWSVPGEASPAERVAVIGVNIADNGSLAEAAVEKSSGDTIFDRSAMRAVYQAAPFPPVPEGVRDKIRSAGGLAVRFTPRGMQ